MRVKSDTMAFHTMIHRKPYLISKHPDTEFVQLQINYLDWDRGVQSADYETAENTETRYIMEPVKAVCSPEGSEIEKVFKAANPNVSALPGGSFAASLEGLITMLSGMTNMQQLKDNIKTIKNLILSSEEIVVHKAVKVLEAYPEFPAQAAVIVWTTAGKNKHTVPYEHIQRLSQIQGRSMDEFAFSTAQ